MGINQKYPVSLRPALGDIQNPVTLPSLPYDRFPSDFQASRTEIKPVYAIFDKSQGQIKVTVVREHMPRNILQKTVFDEGSNNHAVPAKTKMNFVTTYTSCHDVAHAAH